jgi:hypothetical protein
VQPQVSPQDHGTPEMTLTSFFRNKQIRKPCSFEKKSVLRFVANAFLASTQFVAKTNPPRLHGSLSRFLLILLI